MSFHQDEFHQRKFNCKVGVKIILEDIVKEKNEIALKFVDPKDMEESYFVMRKYEDLLEKIESRLRALQRGSGF